MNHLENIHRLFSKNFVETPLLESYDGGELFILSGKLVVCDPIITPDKEPFEFVFPKGTFPVHIHKEKESGLIAYVELVFSQEIVEKWELAVCKNQKIEDLKEGEIFGFPVESSLACLMDFETQNRLNQEELKLFEEKKDNFKGIYQEVFHEHFFNLKNEKIADFSFINFENKNNLFVCEAGYGEGFYATYIGFDKKNNPVKIIIEFIEIEVQS